MNLRKLTGLHLRASLASLLVLAGTSAMVEAQTYQQVQAAATRVNSRQQMAQFWAAANNWPVTLSFPNGRIAKLIAVDNGRPLYITTKDRDGARTIAAHLVWPGAASGLNLTGAGTIVGIWDDGAVYGHAEFGSRLSYGDNAGMGQHATWVAATVAAAGVNGAAKGPAYASAIKSYDWGNNYPELLSASSTGLRISNHSYGLSQGWVFGARGDGKWVWYGDPTLSQVEDWNLGFYGPLAREWDDTQFNMPNHILVLPSGNERLEGPPTQPVDHWVFENGNWTSNTTQVRNRNGGPNGYDSLTSDFTAKNPIVVSAINKIPGGYANPNNVVMSNFANWGPTDDGRIKPDLTAPGVSMFSAATGGGYDSVDGTSFAAPSVAGGISLFLQAYNTLLQRTPRGATLKAIALHTADEAGPNPGPDYVFGWGLMNSLRGSLLIQQAAFEPTTIQEQRLNSGQIRNTTVQVGSGPEFRVTLAWFDPPAAVATKALNSRASMLVNDLDLRVINQTTGQVYLPYKLDPANPANAATRGDNTVDNVEQIVIANPTAGNYTIRVSHKGTALRPSGGQDYSVVVSAPIAGGLESMIINPSTVIGGLQSTFGTVVLSETRNEPTVLQLSSNNPGAVQIPSSITIPANQSSTSFLINTRSVQTTQTVRIFAGGEVGSVNGEMTVTPITLGNNLTLSVNEIVGGNDLTGTVLLNSPAPIGGATVYLTSSNPSKARSIRNWIQIPAGQTQGTFDIRTWPVFDPTNVTINARRGTVTASSVLRVNRAGIMSLTSASTAPGGTNVLATITMDGPAPSGGASIQLASSNTAVATVPGMVVVPAGSRTATVLVRTLRPTVSTPVTITATRFGVARQKTITVNP